jgi:hypothetical protein
MDKVKHSAAFIVATMASLLVQSAAAVERPGTGLYAEEPSPFGSNSISFGRVSFGRQYYVATQSADCDSTSTANPALFGQRDAVDRNLYPPSDYSPFGRSNSPYYDVSPGSLGGGDFEWNNELSFRADIQQDYAGFGAGTDTSSLQFRLLPSSGSLGDLPGPGTVRSQIGFDADPILRVVNPSSGGQRANSNAVFDKTGLAGAAQPLRFTLPRSSVGSFNVSELVSRLPPRLQGMVTQSLNIRGQPYATISYDAQYDRGIVLAELSRLGRNGIMSESNWCRRKLVPNDPNYIRSARNGGGSWGQPSDDQWAIKRVGFTDTEGSAWNSISATATPIVVAVIDTGLDWHHLDMDWKNIWQNPNEIPDNGIDDDRNGYVDDIIGWDFLAQVNKPWDLDGHGTVVSGIIAATRDNNIGIAGISDHAQLMVLKAVNNFGATRASYIAEAIMYAVDNGARIINLSVGGPHSSVIEQAALDYANENNVLVIAAAGNEGVELDDHGPGGSDSVLTVGATFFDDRAADFSNYGERIDLVAPGVDIVSLRARYTDTNFAAEESSDYEIGTNYVGEDKRYLHVSGTSFSTPIVTATASLVLANNPALTAAEVRTILLQTAEDVEAPGKDEYTGYGMVNATAALSVEAGFFVTAEIIGVDKVQTQAGTILHVQGTIDADGFKRAWMQIGAGDNPGVWKFVGQKRKYAIHDGILGVIPLGEFSQPGVWQVVINVEHRNGIRKSARYPVNIK